MGFKVVFFVSVLTLMNIQFLFCQIPDSSFVVSNSDYHSTVELTQFERDNYIQAVQTANNNTMIYTTLIFLFFTIANLAIMFRSISRIENEFKEINSQFLGINDGYKATLCEFKRIEENNMKMDVDVSNAIFVSMLANNQIGFALDWCIRVVKKEFARKDKRRKVINDNIMNLSRLTEQMIEFPIKEIPDLFEAKENIINNLSVFTELSNGDYLELEYKEKCRTIQDNILKILGSSVS